MFKVHIETSLVFYNAISYIKYKFKNQTILYKCLIPNFYKTSYWKERPN